MSFKLYASTSLPKPFRLTPIRVPFRRKTKSGFSKGDEVKIKDGRLPYLRERYWVIEKITYFPSAGGFEIRCKSKTTQNVFGREEYQTMYFTPSEVDHVQNVL